MTLNIHEHGDWTWQTLGHRRWPWTYMNMVIEHDKHWDTEDDPEHTWTWWLNITNTGTPKMTLNIHEHGDWTWQTLGHRRWPWTYMNMLIEHDKHWDTEDDPEHTWTCWLNMTNTGTPKMTLNIHEHGDWTWQTLGHRRWPWTYMNMVIEHDKHWDTEDDPEHTWTWWLNMTNTGTQKMTLNIHEHGDWTWQTLGHRRWPWTYMNMVIEHDKHWDTEDDPEHTWTWWLNMTNTGTPKMTLNIHEHGDWTWQTLGHRRWPWTYMNMVIEHDKHWDTEDDPEHTWTCWLNMTNTGTPKMTLNIHEHADWTWQTLGHRRWPWTYMNMLIEHDKHWDMEDDPEHTWTCWLNMTNTGTQKMTLNIHEHGDWTWQTLGHRRWPWTYMNMVIEHDKHWDTEDDPEHTWTWWLNMTNTGTQKMTLNIHEHGDWTWQTLGHRRWPWTYMNMVIEHDKHWDTEDDPEHTWTWWLNMTNTGTQKMTLNIHEHGDWTWQTLGHGRWPWTYMNMVIEHDKHWDMEDDPEHTWTCWLNMTNTGTPKMTLNIHEHADWTWQTLGHRRWPWTYMNMLIEHDKHWDTEDDPEHTWTCWLNMTNTGTQKMTLNIHEHGDWTWQTLGHRRWPWTYMNMVIEHDKHWDTEDDPEHTWTWWLNMTNTGTQKMTLNIHEHGDWTWQTLGHRRWPWTYMNMVIEHDKHWDTEDDPEHTWTWWLNMTNTGTPKMTLNIHEHGDWTWQTLGHGRWPWTHMNMVIEHDKHWDMEDDPEHTRTWWLNMTNTGTQKMTLNIHEHGDWTWQTLGHRRWPWTYMNMVIEHDKHWDTEDDPEHTWTWWLNMTNTGTQKMTLNIHEHGDWTWQTLGHQRWPWTYMNMVIEHDKHWDTEDDPEHTWTWWLNMTNTGTWKMTLNIHEHGDWTWQTLGHGRWPWTYMNMVIEHDKHWDTEDDPEHTWTWWLNMTNTGTRKMTLNIHEHGDWTWQTLGHRRWPWTYMNMVIEHGKHWDTEDDPEHTWTWWLNMTNTGTPKMTLNIHEHGDWTWQTLGHRRWLNIHEHGDWTWQTLGHRRWPWTYMNMVIEHDKHWDTEDDPEHTWTWWLNMTNTGTRKMTLNIHEHGDWTWQTLGHRRWLNIHEHGDWTWQTLGHRRWPWTYMNMVIEHDKHWDTEDDPEHTWTWWLNMTNTGTSKMTEHTWTWWLNMTNTGTQKMTLNIHEHGDWTWQTLGHGRWLNIHEHGDWTWQTLGHRRWPWTYMNMVIEHDKHWDMEDDWTYMNMVIEHDKHWDTEDDWTYMNMVIEHDKHWDTEDDPEHTWTWWLNMTNTGTQKMTLNIHEHGDWTWQTLGHRRWPWTYMNMVIEHDKHWDTEDDPEHTWTCWLNMTNTGTQKMTLNIHEHGDWTWQTLGHGRWPWTYMNMVIEHDKHWDTEDDPEHTWTWWLNMTNTGTQKMTLNIHEHGDWTWQTLGHRRWPWTYMNMLIEHDKHWDIEDDPEHTWTWWLNMTNTGTWKMTLNIHEHGDWTWQTLGYRRWPWTYMNMVIEHDKHWDTEDDPEHTWTCWLNMTNTGTQKMTLNIHEHGDWTWQTLGHRRWPWTYMNMVIEHDKHWDTEDDPEHTWTWWLNMTNTGTQKMTLNIHEHGDWTWQTLGHRRWPWTYMNMVIEHDKHWDTEDDPEHTWTWWLNMTNTGTRKMTLNIHEHGDWTWQTLGHGRWPWTYMNMVIEHDKHWDMEDDWTYMNMVIEHDKHWDTEDDPEHTWTWWLNMTNTGTQKMTLNIHEHGDWTWQTLGHRRWLNIHEHGDWTWQTLGHRRWPWTYMNMVIEHDKHWDMEDDWTYMNMVIEHDKHWDTEDDPEHTWTWWLNMTNTGTWKMTEHTWTWWLNMTNTGTQKMTLNIHEHGDWTWQTLGHRRWPWTYMNMVIEHDKHWDTEDDPEHTWTWWLNMTNTGTQKMTLNIHEHADWTWQTLGHRRWPWTYMNMVIEHDKHWDTEDDPEHTWTWWLNMTNTGTQKMTLNIHEHGDWTWQTLGHRRWPWTYMNMVIEHDKHWDTEDDPEHTWTCWLNMTNTGT